MQRKTFYALLAMALTAFWACVIWAMILAWCYAFPGACS